MTALMWNRMATESCGIREDAVPGWGTIRTRWPAERDGDELRFRTRRHMHDFGTRHTRRHLPHGKSATASSNGRVPTWGAGVRATRTSLAVLAGSIVPAKVQWSRTKGRLVAVKISGPSAN